MGDNRKYFDGLLLQCNSCKEKLPLTQFHKCSKTKSKHVGRCKECVKKYDYYYKRKVPKTSKYIGRMEYNKDSMLKNKYKISLENYYEMCKAQDNKCAICKQPEEVVTKFGKSKNLSVDHCHQTGKVRGLLCNKCNTGLGSFRDDLEYLNQAIEYLKKNSERDNDE